MVPHASRGPLRKFSLIPLDPRVPPAQRKEADLNQYEQLQRFLEEMIDATLDAEELIEQDAKRARRSLAAIARDLRTLEALLEAMRKR